MTPKVHGKRTFVQATDDRAAAASAFVLEHLRTIYRYARQFANATVTPDDLANAAVLRILEQFSFSPTRGSASNYIYWQVRAALITDWRTGGRGRCLHFDAPGEEGATFTLDRIPGGAFGDHHAPERAVELNEALAEIDDDLAGVGRGRGQWRRAEIAREAIEDYYAEINGG